MTDDIRRKLEGNLRRFIIFRLFYSARFYYPVLTILFLDYGLTLEQFAILNIAWALTIVVAEVPSGALADIVGRKRLIIFAAVMMVVEMSLIAFVPLGASPLLFSIFLLNRVCSGLSEAAASGADEALAYDSLKALGRESEWAQLLEKTTRVVAIGFFITMIVGAFVYDSDAVNRALALLGSEFVLADTVAMRLPIILTLITAVIVFVTTLGFYDLDKVEGHSAAQLSPLADSFRQIVNAASWTCNHRFVLFVILSALALDSVARQFVVLASEYYRLINIPVSWFGFIGAGMSLIGIVNARLARHMVAHHSPFANFFILSALLFFSLVGLVFAIPFAGVVFAIGAFVTLGMVQFQSSYYINRAVESKIRATVLSFRGLALNLGLGLASLFYTGLVIALKTREGSSGLDAEDLKELVYLDALYAFPVYYLALVLLIVIAARILMTSKEVLFRQPTESD